MTIITTFAVIIYVPVQVYQLYLSKFIKLTLSGVILGIWPISLLLVAIFSEPGQINTFITVLKSFVFLVIFLFIYYKGLGKLKFEGKHPCLSYLCIYIKENIKEILFVYLFIVIVEFCMILAPNITESNSGHLTIFIEIFISYLSALFYTILLNAFFGKKRIKIPYFEMMIDNKIQRIYIYSQIDSDTFLCGTSRNREDNNNKVIFIPKSDFAPRKKVIKIEFVDETNKEEPTSDTKEN